MNCNKNHFRLYYTDQASGLCLLVQLTNTQ